MFIKIRGGRKYFLLYFHGFFYGLIITMCGKENHQAAYLVIS